MALAAPQRHQTGPAFKRIPHSFSRPPRAGGIDLSAFKAWDTPTFRTAYIPHVLEAIISAADRPTQAVCLRVNRMFHAVAAPHVYKSVTLDDDTTWSLLRGALIPDKKRGINHQPPMATRQREQVLVDVLGYKQRGTNFKASLLSHVKILTLGSHEGALCGHAGHVAPLFPNVEILRFAPNVHPNNEHTLRQVCDGGLGTDMCELQNGLDPKKLIFRNLDADALLYSPGKEWNGPKLDSVVYFYPADSRRYLQSPWAEIASHFTDIKDFKIVFWPRWEPEDRGARGPVAPISPDKIIMPLKQLVQERTRETCMDCMHDMMAALDEEDSDYEDNVNRVIRQATKCQCVEFHAPAVVIYGLENLLFEPAGEVFITWRSLYPHIPLTQATMAKMVEEEIRSSIIGRTYAARIMAHDVLDPPKVNVKFGTIEEYLINCVREGEVAATD